MSNLQEVGARAVVENMPKFQSAMDAINRALDKSGEKAEQAAKRSSALERAHDRMALTAIKVSNRINNAMTGITAAVSGMAAKVVAAIGTVITIIGVGLVAAIGLAVAGIGAFVGALIALSGRGANYEGIIDSFERLTASVQISSNALYSDLRRAAKGTIPDLQLLRMTNLALAGATGEAGKAFGEALPRLMEIARAQARATGQSVEYLFESLITGIKRGSPLLIDNTGLMLKVGEANQAYAESLGKTVDQLTAQEQQIALLTATLEAGEAAIATYGNAAETLATKLERARAAITNTLDYLALAMQPVAKAIMDAVNSILTGIADFVREAVPYLQAIGQLIVRALQPILQQIAGIGEQLGSPGAARTFFAGAVNTFGSFLRGVVLMGARIIQAVADIAQAIANFLIGQSPPPMGPLSKIDVGGANVMLAWLDGFIGGFSLDPVERVAQQVVDAMGPIATMALAQVEARLAQLDAALKPFQDRLSIVRAEFDAIAKIGDIAMQRIERQLNTAVQALVRGEAGSGELVRKLDAQRAAIEAAVEAQRQNTEEYELQLAMAEALQARERALLNIRKAQLPTLERTVKTVEKTAKEAKGPKEKEPSGSGDLPEMPGAPFEAAPIEDLFGIGSDPRAIKKAMRVIETEWENAFGDAGDIWEASNVSLQKSGIALGDALRNLPNRLDSEFSGAFETLKKTVETQWKGIQTSFQNFVDVQIPEALGGLASSIQTNIVDPFVLHTKPIRDLFAGADTPGSIASWVDGISATLAGVAGSIASAIQTNIVDPFNEATEPIRTLFAGAETEGSFAYLVAQIPTHIQNGLTNLETRLTELLVTPVQNKIADVRDTFDTFFNGEGEGTLHGIFDAALEFLGQVPAKVGEALRAVGGYIWSTFAVPIISTINTVITAFQNFFINLVRGIADGIDQIGTIIQDAALGLGIDPGLGGALKLFSIDLFNQAGGISFDPIDIASPFAKGGIAGPGLMKVGERGPELIASAQRLAVFPSRVTRALEAIADVAPQSSSYVHPSVVNNSSTYDNSRNYNDTFIVNGVQSAGEWRREWAMAKAFR